MGIYYFCSGFDKIRSFDGALAKELKRDIKDTNNLLFIPGTNKSDGIDKTFSIQIPRFINYFKKINIIFENVNCITPNIEISIAKELIKNADIIIMLGGNPFEVRELLIEKDLINVLKSYNGIIIGISAGAMNMSKYIITTPCSEEFNKFDIRKGLNLCEISIFPHCNFYGEVFLDSYEHDGRVTKKIDLEKVANDYGEFYLLQDYRLSDDLVDASFIRVDEKGKKFIKNNNGKIWIVKNNGIFLIKF